MRGMQRKPTSPLTEIQIFVGGNREFRLVRGRLNHDESTPSLSLLCRLRFKLSTYEHRYVWKIMTCAKQGCPFLLRTAPGDPIQ